MFNSFLIMVPCDIPAEYIDDIKRFTESNYYKIATERKDIDPDDKVYGDVIPVILKPLATTPSHPGAEICTPHRYRDCFGILRDINLMTNIITIEITDPKYLQQSDRVAAISIHKSCRAKLWLMINPWIGSDSDTMSGKCEIMIRSVVLYIPEK